jgi:hypothetical protein
MAKFDKHLGVVYQVPCWARKKIPDQMTGDLRVRKFWLLLFRSRKVASNVHEL